MRIIEKPAQVRVVDRVDLHYDMFVKHLLDTDTRFGRNGAGLRAAVRIEQALREHAAVHMVEESDWDLLHKAAEEPSAGYPLMVQSNDRGDVVGRHPTGRACLPFIEAIANAKPKPGDA